MRKLRTSLIALALLGMFLLNSCGKKEKTPEEQAKESAQNSVDAMSKMAEGMQKGLAGDHKPAPPVSFKVLMNYLPTSLSGLKSDKPEGETTSMGEWNFSVARVRFTSENGEQSAHIEVSDFAYINALYMPYQFLMKMNYNHESSNGYEKSTKVSGFPAMEKWTAESKDNEVTVLTGERFLIHVETNGMPEGSAKKIAEGMNTGKLANEKAG